jgi:YVTN family beta-propeller protein
VGPKPRFLTAGGGSIWTLNQGDGTVSRVDEKNRKVIATIQVSIPGSGRAARPYRCHNEQGREALGRKGRGFPTCRLRFNLANGLQEGLAFAISC